MKNTPKAVQPIPEATVGRAVDQPGQPAVDVEVVPTQVRRPWRSMFRTAVQVAIPTILSLGIVVPEIVKIVMEEAGESMPAGVRLVLLGVSGAIVAIAAALSRIMAIPQVEAFLRRYKLLKGLAAAPEPPAAG